MKRRLFAYVLRALGGLTLLGFATTPAWVCDVENGFLRFVRVDGDFDDDDFDDDDFEDDLEDLGDELEDIFD